MNVLILTGRFGMGHIKAAEAIRESILAKDPQVRVNIVDFTEYLFPQAADHIYKGFHFLVNHCSHLYNFCNRLADRYGATPFQAALLKKIDFLLDTYCPDLVIATLPFCGQYISTWKRVSKSRLPLYTYITDVTLHEEWISAGTDLYFVAANTTRNALLTCGVPSHKIIVSGIPVRQRFYPSGSSCRHTRKPEKNLRILIMGGGLGMISCSPLLLSQLHSNPQILTTVITGKNSHLASQLRTDYPDFRIIGYTEEVHRYMKDADLLITKPGGITIFEAIAAETPLFLLQPSLQQEKENAKFVEEKGLGCLLMPDAEILKDLVTDRALLHTMRQNMSKLTERYENDCPLKYFTNHAG